jgi:DNA-directed RNA polymerase subunit beta'
MAYHQARKVKDAMDEAERRAIAESEAAELAGVGSTTEEAIITVEASEGSATE